MSDKLFRGILIILVAGLLTILIVSSKKNDKASAPPLGVSYSKQGESHIAVGQGHEKYNSDPASSGPHYGGSVAPLPWGVYTQEVPDEVFLHNEEHGGVIVTYNPKLLPADQLKKLQALFSPPYSDKKFLPSKAIVTPRSKNTKPIELAAWTYTLSLDSFDQAKLENFYLQRVGKSPEPAAGPTNKPINQAQ